MQYLSSLLHLPFTPTLMPNKKYFLTDHKNPNQTHPKLNPKLNWALSSPSLIYLCVSEHQLENSSQFTLSQNLKCDHLTIKARITTPTDAPIVNRAHFGNVDIQTGSISFSGDASLMIRVQISPAQPFVRTELLGPFLRLRQDPKRIFRFGEQKFLKCLVDSFITKYW